MTKHETTSAELLQKLEALRHRLDQIDRGLDRVEDAYSRGTDTVCDGRTSDTVDRSGQDGNWPKITELAVEASGVIVLAIDSKGRIIHFNEGAEQLTGFSEGEVLGKSIWRTLVPQEEVGKMKLAIAELRAGKQRSRHESMIFKRDGSRCLIAWVNIGVPEASGNLQYIVSSGFDISEKKGRNQQSGPLSEIRARLDQLSPRENEVLRLVVAGKPNKAIAHQLEISIKTVEHHRSNLMKKMRVSSVAELVRMTMLAGWS